MLSPLSFFRARFLPSSFSFPLSLDDVATSSCIYLHRHAQAPERAARMDSKPPGRVRARKGAQVSSVMEHHHDPAGLRAHLRERDLSVSNSLGGAVGEALGEALGEIRRERDEGERR